MDAVIRYTQGIPLLANRPGHKRFSVRCFYLISIVHSSPPANMHKELPITAHARQTCGIAHTARTDHRRQECVKELPYIRHTRHTWGAAHRALTDQTRENMCSFFVAFITPLQHRGK